MRTDEIRELRAEVMLNYLYPELEGQWTANHDGTFYRNYNRDAMEVNLHERRVRLSRDGFLRLLPQGVLTMEAELRENKKLDIQERHKQMEWRRKLLTEAFLPIDTFYFRKQLKIERQVSQLLEGKLAYVLEKYFGFDLTKERNPYVREMAVLLPYVRQWRGDFGLIRNILRDLFGCPVNMIEHRYSDTDSTRDWVPMIRYELLIDDLSAEEYRVRQQAVQPLEDFVREWMVPVEVVCQIAIKEHNAVQLVGQRLTLDYNTELINENR